jgi:hypothetical protein
VLPLLSELPCELDDSVAVEELGVPVELDGPPSASLSEEVDEDSPAVGLT